MMAGIGGARTAPPSQVVETADTEKGAPGGDIATDDDNRREHLNPGVSLPFSFCRVLRCRHPGTATPKAQIGR
jgi:hypothetical protein